MTESYSAPAESRNDTKANIRRGLKFLQGVAAGIGIGLVVADLVSAHFGLQGPTPDIVGGATGATAMALLAKITHLV